MFPLRRGRMASLKSLDATNGVFVGWLWFCGSCNWERIGACPVHRYSPCRAFSGFSIVHIGLSSSAICGLLIDEVKSEKECISSITGEGGVGGPLKSGVSALYAIAA